jgi:hypothetical protein
VVIPRRPSRTGPRARSQELGAESGGPGSATRSGGRPLACAV